jgi:hypothetical protein
MREGLEEFRGEITFKGELGQTPNWDEKITLTVGELREIRSGSYTAVFNPNRFPKRFHKANFRY